MGLGMSSCGRSREESDFFRAVQSGDCVAVAGALAVDPELISCATIYDRLSPLHIAAGNGHLQVVSMLLDRLVSPDVVNRHKQTPLMLAAMHGKVECVRKLVNAGANIVMFDSSMGRSCLHLAAFHGHADCLRMIIAASQTASVADSWGFARFVNTRDGKGATPLHLAARQGHSDCVHLLLDSGAIVSATTGSYCFPSSTPLHLAARSGNLDVVRQLLAWDADRRQRDSVGLIPYEVALRRRHRACAALLNPAAAAPLVWPSPIKFMNELKPDAKALLEEALLEANRAREEKIFSYSKSCSPPSSCSNGGTCEDNPEEEGDGELCGICFDQVCTIEVEDCRHQMCAPCTLALCCHSKPNATTKQCHPSPSCPFCRGTITRLVVAKPKTTDDEDRANSPRPCQANARRSRNPSEGSSSSSFKSLSSAFGILGRGSGRITDSIDFADDKS